MLSTNTNHSSLILTTRSSSTGLKTSSSSASFNCGSNWYGAMVPGLGGELQSDIDSEEHELPSDDDIDTLK